MKDENFEQNVADDGLFIGRETTIDDIQQFLRHRVENPVQIEETTIWDFCSYERNEQALEEAVRIKLQADKYIIPYQVTGVWGYLYHLLPADLRDAEILVYDPRAGMYKGYKNYSRDLSPEQQQSFRQDLARRVADADPDSLTFD